MKCWAIRKMLPLSIGSGDLPSFLDKFVYRHLDQCSCCSQDHQAYLVRKEDLQAIKKSRVPNESFSDYWQELAAKVDKLETKEKISSESAFWHSIFSPQVSLKMGAFAVLVVMITGSIINISQMENSVSPPSSVNTPAFLVSGDLVPSERKEESNSNVSSEVFDFNVIYNDENVLEEYRLDQALPCVLQDTASF